MGHLDIPAAASGRPQLRVHTLTARGLLLLAAGERRAAGFARGVGRPDYARRVLRRLGRLGLITPAWNLTPAGEAEAARLAAWWRRFRDA